MSDLTYSELQNLTYDELSAKTYSLEGETGSGSNTSGGSCIWTDSRIAAIENRLAEILSKMDTLAKPSDLQVTTQTVHVTTQEMDLSELKAYGDTNWKTADGFATSEALLTAREDILSSISLFAGSVPENVWNAADRTLTSYPSSESVDLSEVTEMLERIFALIARWNVTGNTLTAYSASGSILGTFTLTRDSNGEIVGVSS
ncbi:MAG: hypothetical protein IJF17_00880 [Thermoguttaceae bacterium]|nr:hypothetical protein [Thermoguttaceae bacterium]